MRGLVEVLLQRSETTGDGTPVMETTGQIPGSCEELFGLRGNSKSELVGASQEWLGRKKARGFSRSDEDGDKRCATERRDCSTKKSGDHVLGWMLAGRRASGSSFIRLW